MDEKLIVKIEECLNHSIELTKSFVDDIDKAYKHPSDDAEFEFYMHGLQKIFLTTLARNDYKKRLKLS